MYRVRSSVTARAANLGGWAWGCGRRGVHQRARLPPLGHGWVGGLGEGKGLELGVKLAGGLRGAAPAPPPAAPDPEASPQAEAPRQPEQSLAPWAPQTPTPPLSKRFAKAIKNSRDLLHRIKDEVGAPGIVVGVSVDGKEVWSEGLGYADVENRVPCKPETVMRIASISKSLTMVALAKLWEAGKLDLDIPVQYYVPEFPEKEYEGEKVSVTTRLLISHLSGIRHYEKDMKKVKEEKAYKALKMMKETMEFDQEKQLREKGGKSNEKNDFAKAQIEQDNEAKGRNSKPGKKKNDFEQGELYLKEKFENSIESLRLFKNDPLFFKPGSQFLYSTFGYTLLAAIVERASGCKYLDYMQKIFHDLDMLTTVQEENEPVIYNRASFCFHCQHLLTLTLLPLSDVIALGPPRSSKFLNYTVIVTASSKYRHTSFYCILQILCFLQTEGLWQPSIKQVCCTTFPTASAHFVSLCHVLVILAIFQTFSSFISYGDL
ncbi:serine beta-lactamase-like protein LACTB, mitochondrial isoform X2 [Trichechus manatus latirostris]|uniref:Serine beta-lactamase-like protein LACTB, mitochondrial isoform X2 n=1 Tax=Trichechus manatus latirostris TaxID=127582 RepID=A0A2Y9QPS5_TRIMA|nr:serine beta-lactamase-like protein LACTB, mitochondrial isoform X2 [Trichechus manatus latirostris]